MKIKVHRNLNKGCWSVRLGAKVIMHAISLTLANCTFHVSKAGRKRVLKQRRKNVHAYVQGTLTDTCPRKGQPISYNPYRADTFVTKTGRPIHEADAVHFGEDGRAYVLKRAA